MFIVGQTSKNSNRKHKCSKYFILNYFKVRWIRFFDDELEIVKPSNGGGSRFITINKDDDPDFRCIAERALSIFFPHGFQENIEFSMLDFTQNELNENDQVRTYLKEKGLFSSRTWFFLKTQSKKLDSTSITSEKKYPKKRALEINQQGVECPICYRGFQKSDIEVHASTCQVSITMPVTDDEEDTTIAYDECIFSDENDSVSENNAIDILIEEQQKGNTQHFRVLRYKAWEVYVKHCNKKWFKRNSLLGVAFIGENAVGAGPRKEFFQGILL